MIIIPDKLICCCGSCGSVIRLVPAFSRGLTSYPGAQFSCVEILTREDVP